MLYHLKTLMRYLLIFFIYQGVSYAIEIESMNHAVDVAGKQRMFTQRMLKDYAMIGMQNSFGNPVQDLNDTVISFENHLEALETYGDKREIKESAKKIKKLWKPIRKLLEEEAKQASVGKLQEDLELLLASSNNLTELFAKATGEKAGEIINISGRQRMLSQRMASLYMLKAWGVGDKKFQEKMSASMKLFKESLEKLKSSELNNEKIDKLLNKVEKSFMFFEVMSDSKTTFIPTLIYKKSNDILENMNTVTHEYVSVSKK